MLKTMEEKKLIYREPDTVDKRSVRIFLTELGKTKKEISRETVLYFNNKVRELVPESKLKIFFEVMNEINHSLPKELPKQKMFKTINYHCLN